MPPARALAALLLAFCACGPDRSGTREVVPLSGPGWTLWLDTAATWEQDPIHPPGVDLARLPTRPPGCGWEALPAEGRAVSVPATVEGLVWPELGDHRGVSWWSRELVVPESARGRVARLRFDAVRLAAEVFLDGRLVGYDAVGHTPFTVDLGDAAIPGAVQRLDVRVTDPGGNFDWIDHTAHRWGEAPIPPSHGFGGILGDVRLEVVDEVHVHDVFVRNTADPTTVQVQIALAGAEGWSGAARLSIRERDGPTLHEQAVPAPPGGWGGPARVSVTLPEGRLWWPDDPVLHEATVSLPDGDALTVRFGLRWFAPEGVGEDAVLRLNGRRIVARSAISWGFWPVTGAVPSRELAARQVRSAKALGLNMINHHRNMAHPWALDASDELGLLAHLEPGGYWAQGGDALTRALASARWRRMVEANRNRPSVVILNMINEATEPPWEGALDDLVAARLLDPSRTMTYTSAWADEDDPALSLHLRPRPSGWDDGEQARAAPTTEGWHDQHEAPGPGCWRDAFYDGPADFRLFTENRGDVVWRGEEAAIAAPPRLALMPDPAADGESPGWDGEHYARWRAGWERDLSAMALLEPLGGLDAVTRSAAAVAHDHHARTLARVRAADVVDGYVVNGWECEPFENHSGLVDIRREPKADPGILAAANAPALVVVAPRAHVLHGARDMGAGVRAPAVVEVDLFAVNELGLSGRHRLRLVARDEDGAALAEQAWEVDLVGGERYGQLLVEGARLQLDRRAGRVALSAELIPPDGGPPVAVGREELSLVDWRSVEVPDDGALVGGSRVVESFLRQAKGLGLPAYDPAGPAPTWVVLAGVDPEPSTPVLRRAFPGDESWALRVDGGPWQDGTEDLRTDRIYVPSEVPLPGGGTTGAERWEQRWSGLYLAEESGPHRFHLQTTLGARLSVAGQRVLDAWEDLGPRRLSSASVELEAFEGAPFELEVRQEKDAAAYRLELTTPRDSAPFRALAASLLEHVAEGTTLVVLDHTGPWARLFSERGAFGYEGDFHVGRYWMGGGYLAAEHPLLAGLPTGGALGWEWQELVRSDRPHAGLRLGDGAETVVAVWSDHKPSLGSALAVVPHGRGRIVLCALPLVQALDAPPGAVAVPRRLLCNLLAGP